MRIEKQNFFSVRIFGSLFTCLLVVEYGKDKKCVWLFFKRKISRYKLLCIK